MIRLLNLNKLIPQKQHDSFLLPKGVVVLGNLEANVPGRIDGHLEGNIISSSKLIIGQDAVIQGNIAANHLIIYGKVEGDIDCKTKAIICNNALVKGAIIATTLEIEEGAIIEGAMTKNKFGTEVQIPDDKAIPANNNSSPVKQLNGNSIPSVAVRKAIPINNDDAGKWF